MNITAGSEYIREKIGAFKKFTPLLRELVVRDIKVRYRHSARLGMDGFKSAPHDGCYYDCLFNGIQTEYSEFSDLLSFRLINILV